MRGIEWVSLGIIVTFLLLVAFTSLLPPSSKFGVHVNPDITVVIEDHPSTKQGKGREKFNKNNHKQNKVSTHINSPSSELDVQVASLKTKIDGLQSLLEEMSHSSSSLRGLISQQSKHPISISGKCIPVEEIKIEEITSHLRSPAWFESRKDSLLEDRSYLDFLANHYIPRSAPRTIYIDVGAQEFASSVDWMHKNYPLNFSEIYAFEEAPNVFRVPPREQIGGKYFDSIHFRQVKVGTRDTANEMDFAKWMKEVLKPSVADFVVLKIDIEGGEWDVLPKLESAGLHAVIDELFVEIHFNHPDLSGWKIFSHSPEEALALLRRWRALGVYAHSWP